MDKALDVIILYCAWLCDIFYAVSEFVIFSNLDRLQIDRYRGRAPPCWSVDLLTTLLLLLPVFVQ